MQQLLQQQMQEQAQEQIQRQMQEEQLNLQIKLIINQILTPEARGRLGNIRIARPDFARAVEIFLIQLYQQGKLRGTLDDKQLKEILMKLKEGKKEISIKK